MIAHRRWNGNVTTGECVAPQCAANFIRVMLRMQLMSRARRPCRTPLGLATLAGFL